MRCALSIGTRVFFESRDPVSTLISLYCISTAGEAILSQIPPERKLLLFFALSLGHSRPPFIIFVQGTAVSSAVVQDWLTLSLRAHFTSYRFSHEHPRRQIPPLILSSLFEQLWVARLFNRRNLAKHRCQAASRHHRHDTISALFPDGITSYHFTYLRFVRKVFSGIAGFELDRELESILFGESGCCHNRSHVEFPSDDASNGTTTTATSQCSADAELFSCNTTTHL